MQRRLAVILAADVVGYSAQMERDEEGTFARVQALRRDVVDPVAARHQGRVFKTMGDGFLMEFGSVAGAVSAALELLAAQGQGADLAMRIGINFGEVIVEGDDLFGDGVNIAARLEQSAEPGSILVSGKVRDEAAGKVAAEFRDLGRQSLRNLAQPVQVYRVQPPQAVLTADAGELPLPERPSIAVLPFTNMSADPQQEFFADGMTEDLITALSRIGELFVISRHSSFFYKGRPNRIETVARELGVRYVLEGSVRVGGPRMRITAQLIDGRSGAHVWAERYDVDTADVFAVQDEITHSIVLALQVRLASGDFARLWDGQTRNLRAWERMAQARALFLRFTAVDNLEARRLLQEAIMMDPDYSGAIVLLGLTHWVDARFNVALNKADCLSACDTQMRRAMATNPRMGSAHMLGGGIDFLSGRHDEAMAKCRLGTELAPSDSWAMAFYGLVCNYSGAPDVALSAFTAAIRLSPHPPAWYYYGLGIAEMWTGNLRAAEATARLDLRLEPHDPYSYVHLALVLGFDNRLGEAAETITQMRQMFPAFGMANIARSEVYKRPEDLDRVMATLRSAGLPG